MTGTTEALGGSAAVDDAARSVTRPFYVYAVLANSLFQRGVFVLFLQQRGFSAGQVTLLQTLLYLVSGLAELPAGVIADRIGRRASIVIGQVLIAGCKTTVAGLDLVLIQAQARTKPVTSRPAASTHAARLISLRIYGHIDCS
ncbi:MFS transporter [Streptomyces sp. NPDC018000]|uniref:MFS transporter n=1 Tax=Streptomyces sp. NPDC018000 TaxID=3365028 RepID=UPI0037B42BD6